ncbi:MAG: hypothetical protein ACE15F_21125 [bacterium]
MDAQFEQAFTQGFVVTKISESYPIQPGIDPGLKGQLQCLKPIAEGDLPAAGLIKPDLPGMQSHISTFMVNYILPFFQ